ncbi:CehA/McbA family metallohydrolase [Pelagibacterium sp. 26DY04]|uniref:CehA/McbA family metallohydrolase n=1 Tax=Pelagibacterium sp. 26DY04 TaxID=2967130 RepID=UPI002814EC63|nr:CehA/McbA family metallohydrolase [Pelagibacterium sp. 26DY04]WMT88433.1 CehA/McbA family metallohydrolase [Pelagibacterium sp. 26DY04]
MRISQTGLSLLTGSEDIAHVRITRSDQEASAYFYVPLDLGEAVEAITVDLQYPKGPGCIIDLGAFDPRVTEYPTTAGFRGWSGGARSQFSIAADAATPGYVAGPLQAGRWLIVLGLYKIPSETVEVTLAARALRTGPLARPQPAPTASTPRGIGWYRGDCHSHTFHSDAKGSPELLHRTARKAGLDFLFITDHNTTTAWTAYFETASSPDLVFIPGVEITTADGHANVLGADEWIDFRLEGDADIAALEDAARARGALLTVNHDKPPIPWRYRWPAVDCMEVWHQEWADGNSGLGARYDALLRQGLKITAIGGSDYHQAAEVRLGGPRSLGSPTTVIHAERLDRQGVIAALRSGLAYITETPDGPHLEISSNGTPMGGTCAQSDGADLRIVARGAGGDLLQLIGDHGVFVQLPIDADDWDYQIPLPSGLRFVRAQIMSGAPDPRCRALSNPLYFQAASR